MKKTAAIVFWGTLLFACGPVEVTVFESSEPEEPPPPPTIMGLGGERPDDEGTGGSAPTTLVLDDFEDEDKKGNEPAGWWYMVNDGTGIQTLLVLPQSETAAPPRDSSIRLLESQVAGFTDWGAAIGIDIANVGPASSAIEVSFVVATNQATEITFHALDGTGSHFTRTFFASTEWNTITLRLDELFIVEGETVRPFAVETADELQWFLFGDTATSLWLDDVTLRYW